MPDQTWTIGRLLSWTTDFLRDKGADSPRLDAEVLLAHARNCQRIELYTAFEELADDRLRELFRGLVQQRATGKPVAYLVGHREFFSLTFAVTPDVLIPRPETEQLVVRALDLATEISSDQPLAVADIGTGSGVLAVCLAKHHEGCLVTAVDVSPAALRIAAGNAQQHGVADRIKWVESDLFDEVAADSQFDLIVSNPPYVKSVEFAELASDVRDYEPRSALDGGEQGTAVIERLISQAASRLRPGGWLLIEISPTIAARVEQLLAASPSLRPDQTLSDVAGHARVAQAQGG